MPSWRVEDIVLKAIVRISISLLILFVLVPYNVTAQIAPTNSAMISGSVSDSSGKPVVGAKVSLSGARSTTTQTDAHGLFVFVGMPFGTYSISAAAAGLGTATRSVSVQGDVNVAIQYEPASQNGLKVIANVSSSANAQFNVTPASITQVNPIADAFEGKTSWRTILEQIPGVAQAGLGNGERTTAGMPDSPFVPVQVSINGALPYETATLLDNMPLIGASGFNSAAGAGTDLSLYPLNSFGAADIVRGPGANAPSIVDSIGGSFVLHSPSAVDHDQYNLSLSTDPYGGIVANARTAVHWKKLSVVVTYGVNDSPGPISNAGIPAENASIVAINGHAFGSSFCGFNVNPNYAQFALYGLQQGLLIDGINQNSSWSQHSGSVALKYQLSSAVNIELFYAGENSYQYSTPVYWTDNFVPPAGYSGSLPAGQYALSTGAGSTFGAYPFTQASSLLEEKITTQLGNGVLQLAALQNRTFGRYTPSTPASLNVQLYGGATLCTDTSLGCSTGTYQSVLFNGGTYTLTPVSCSEIYSSMTDNHDLLFSYATPLGENFHAGASFVRSYYDNPSSTFFNFSGFISTSATPSSVSQTTNESRIFIGGNLSQKTSVDLSTYFVNVGYHVQNPNDPNGNTYTDARYSYTAPRLGFVWRPVPSMSVRAAAGGGFAEAPLGYLIGTSGIPNCSSGTACYVTLTNIHLQPEKSFGFDLGTDIRLHRDTVFSFDVYRTNLYGQFYNSTTISTYTLGGITYPLYTTQEGNLGQTRYEGILVDLHHDASHGMYWTFSGGLTRGYIVSLPVGFYNTPGQMCNFATGAGCKNVNVVPNVNFNGTFTSVSVPYAQGLGILGYRWNPEKYVDVTGTYFGNNNTYFRPAFVELDGHVGYPLTRNISLLATFRNITGIYDDAAQLWSFATFSGAPTVTGLPYPLWQESYGPRTLLLTLNFHSLQ